MARTLFAHNKYWDPVSDHQTIIFIWNQEASARAKWKDNGAGVTRYWNDLFEQYFQKLVFAQAYELVDFLKTKSSIAKINKRQTDRLQSQAKAILELAQTEDKIKAYQARRNLIGQISPN